MPQYTMKFSEFGFDELTADNIIAQINKLRAGDIVETLSFLTKKIGFHPDEFFMKRVGLQLVRSWGLVN